MNVDLHALARETADKIDDIQRKHVAGLFEQPACEALILAALRAVQEHTREWQPIETAPKADHATVLLWCENIAPRASMGYWGDDEWVLVSEYGSYYVPRDPPTHWMPLPKPPGIRSSGQPRSEGQ